MKTLKKTLCLVLAVVMVVGVLVLPASAADEIDYAAKYEEALGVLKGIGVLNGKEDGELHPEQTLTRAEASTIIARMLNGDESAATYPTAGLPFSDTNADAWYAPYVAYCVDIDIIAGDENGKFNPDDEITGTDFAKMVLVAIGFDPVENGFVNAGSKYEANVAKALRQAKLTTGLESVDLSAPMKRGEVAQLAFNGIIYSVTGQTTVFTVTEKETGKVVKTTTDPEEAYYYSQFEDDFEVTWASVYADSLAQNVFNNLREASAGGTDDFGRPTAGWVNGSDTEPNDVYTNAKTPDDTFDGDFTSEDAKEYKIDENWTIYYNGDENVLTVDDLYVDDTTGKNGYEIEVYAADKTVVVCEAYFANVSKIEKDALTLTVYEVGYLQANSNKGVEIELTKKDNADTYNLVAPHADSYIGVYVKSGTLAEGEGEILDVVELTSEDVNITRRDINSDANGDQVAYLSTITVNGADIGLNVEFVRIAKDGTPGHAIPAVPSSGKLFTLNGTALGYVYDPDSNDNTSNKTNGFAYVLDYIDEDDVKAEEDWQDSKGSDVDGGYMVRLWLSDNTVDEKPVKASAKELLNKLVYFELEDGVYTLTLIDASFTTYGEDTVTGAKVDTADKLKITKAVAEGTVTGTEKEVVFDSETLFFVATGAEGAKPNNTVVVTKSIGEVESLVGGDKTEVQYVVGEDGRVIVILVRNPGEDSSDPETATGTYFIVKGKNPTLTKEVIDDKGNTIEYYVLQGVVNGGIEKKIKVGKDVDFGTEGYVYVKTVTEENGVISAVADKIELTKGEITPVSKDVVEIGENSYYVPNTVTVYQFNTITGEVSSTTLDKIEDNTDCLYIASGATISVLFVDVTPAE